MKIVVVQFADDVDVSNLTTGKTVLVGDGTVTVEGAVLAVASIFEPALVLVPHEHTVTGTAK